MRATAAGEWRVGRTHKGKAERDWLWGRSITLGEAFSALVDIAAMALWLVV